MEPINKVAAFISPLFSLSSQAHIFHLQVTGVGSFAAHMALQDLYTQLPELVDKLVETYQGRYGVINEYECPALENTISRERILSYITNVARCIDNERSVFTEPELCNIVDEIQSLISKTVYKLNNLA